jgi:hypothetical protein
LNVAATSKVKPEALRLHNRAGYPRVGGGDKANSTNPSMDGMFKNCQGIALTSLHAFMLMTPLTASTEDLSRCVGLAT